MRFARVRCRFSAVHGILHLDGQFSDTLIDVLFLFLEGLSHGTCVSSEALVVVTSRRVYAVVLFCQNNSIVSPLAFHLVGITVPGGGAFGSTQALLVLSLCGDISSLTGGLVMHCLFDIDAGLDILILDNLELDVICCKDIDSCFSCFSDLGLESRNSRLGGTDTGEFRSDIILLGLSLNLHVSSRDRPVPCGVCSIVESDFLVCNRIIEAFFRP